MQRDVLESKNKDTGRMGYFVFAAFPAVWQANPGLNFMFSLILSCFCIY